MDEATDIQKNIQDIRERNRKVEADKAWETSWFRILAVAMLTYGIACAVLFVIGVSNYLESAIIPTVGYLLSTAPLNILKRWWIHNFFRE